MNKHTSKYCNPKIAHVFYRALFIEGWGGVVMHCIVKRIN
jgi:predicted HTH transcriptional regulator